MEAITVCENQDNSSAVSETVNKLSIYVLDEFLRTHLQPPAVYTFSSDNSSFVCTVSVPSFNETKSGRAKSKKEAKRIAAQNFINYISSSESFKFDSAPTKKEKKCKPTVKRGSGNNFIELLCQYCRKCRLPQPSFTMVEHSTNSLGQSEFSMKCRVKNVEKLGIGISKRQAKGTAAIMVLEALRLGQARRENGCQIDEPPVKRLKTSETAEDVDTSSASWENIVLNTENEETPAENLFINPITYSNGPGDSGVDDGDVCGSDDCVEIIDSTEIFSVGSSSDSDVE